MSKYFPYFNNQVNNRGEVITTADEPHPTRDPEVDLVEVDLRKMFEEYQYLADRFIGVRLDMYTQHYIGRATGYLVAAMEQQEKKIARQDKLLTLLVGEERLAAYYDMLGED